MTEPHKMEALKRESQGLRGALRVRLGEREIARFDADDAQFLKFHGVYQQDDRDLRRARRASGAEKAWMMMVRSKIPGGALSAAQFSTHLELAQELGNGTLRVTSRQGLQLHGVLKGDLERAIRGIVASGITTWGACGDVVRNVVAAPAPYADGPHRQVQELATTLTRAFRARSRAYSEIFLDGEALELDPLEDARASPGALDEAGEEPDPVYGRMYLPRKFKIGVVIPPGNEVDVYTHDLGFVAHVERGEIEGYTALVGGGMGMTHGDERTWPALAMPLGYVAAEHARALALAVVSVQRDFGNRHDRKQARLKYLLAERGLSWFRDEVCRRIAPVPLSEARQFTLESVEDPLGWHEQGDGRFFLGLRVFDGRIDDQHGIGYRTALRTLCRRFERPLRLTPNCNVILADVEPGQRADIDAVLDSHAVPAPSSMARARRFSMACVALPTCGLALGESERVFFALMADIEAVLRDLALEEEPILIRMTGCPNGCARPYNADIAFVGAGPDRYHLFVGGSHRGTRLAAKIDENLPLAALSERVRALLEPYACDRASGESFSDWWGRVSGAPKAHG